MAKKHFGVPMSKEILSDAVFRQRVGDELSGNIRTDLQFQIYDFSTEGEAEALAFVLEFSSPDSQEGDNPIPPHVFRVDRRGVQDLVDRLYDLVRYEKSESE